MKPLPVLLLLLAFVACKDDRKIPDNFDYGQTVNGIYTNEFFGFQFKSPEGWSIQNKEQMKAVMDEGARIIEKNNKDLANQIKAADVRSATLFVAFRYPQDSTGGKFNSSVSIVAENVARVHSVRSGKDYLQSARSMMEKSGINYTFGDYSKETLGGKEFDVLKVDLTMDDIPMKQRYYATIDKNFALVIITTLKDEAEEAEFNDILKGIRFK